MKDLDIICRLIGNTSAEQLVYVDCAVTDSVGVFMQIALIHFNRLLKENGKLFLGDILFDFPPDNYHAEIEGWLEAMHNTAGRQMSDETLTHIRDEYSTWNWVMAGILARAGFHATAHDEPVKNMHTYICSKNPHIESQAPVSGTFTT